MKINIYYGGRGIIDDPSVVVLNRMISVFKELNIKIERYNLYELKNGITSLPATLNDCDGIILAATVEWYGIGGYLSQFLDACWLYGNKETIEKLYMCPIVMSKTSGERVALTNLCEAWEILGGKVTDGICGFVKETMSFEMNKDYMAYIEKKAENLYRIISQKVITLPSSNNQIVDSVVAPEPLELSVQETEQLSKYASDEKYVKKQKEDITELASYFKGMLDAKSVDESTVYIADFKNHFVKKNAKDAVFKFMIADRKVPLIVSIKNGTLDCYYGNTEEFDVLVKIKPETLNKIISGNETFNKAFMVGDAGVKGDMVILRELDNFFVF